MPLCAFVLPLCSREGFVSQLFISIQICHDSPILFPLAKLYIFLLMRPYLVCFNKVVLLFV